MTEAVAVKKRCFVIAPIGAEGSPTRRRSDQVLRYLIAPVIAKKGDYQAPVRADHLPSPGIITAQIVDEIMQADLVVADLSEGNPNVFYELAIRHAIRKPTVQIIGLDWSIPFDVSPTRTIRFDHRDLDSVEQAKTDLLAQICAAEHDPNSVDTPLSSAIDLQAFRDSDNSVEKVLAQVVTNVSSLQAQFNELRVALEPSLGARLLGALADRREVMGFSSRIETTWDRAVREMSEARARGGLSERELQADALAAHTWKNEEKK